MLLLAEVSHVNLSVSSTWCETVYRNLKEELLELQRLEPLSLQVIVQFSLLFDQEHSSQETGR